MSAIKSVLMLLKERSELIGKKPGNIVDNLVDAALIELAQLRAENERLDVDNERMEAGLQAISAWTKAYPLSIFPEPDFKKVRELLAAGGITLDCVSASNMRHVINGVSQLVSDALKEG
jgi:hypothetical protein